MYIWDGIFKAVLETAEKRGRIDITLRLTHTQPNLSPLTDTRARSRYTTIIRLVEVGFSF